MAARYSVSLPPLVASLPQLIIQVYIIFIRLYVSMISISRITLSFFLSKFTCRLDSFESPMEFHRGWILSKFDIVKFVFNACFVRTRATFFSRPPSPSLFKLLITIQRCPSSQKLEKVAKLSILK